jgi:hypothetical protein
VALFIPGPGFITAAILIYDTVMTFMRQLSRLAHLVKGYIDAIMAIASGSIDTAAAAVEAQAARYMTLAITILAGMAGFGKVSKRVQDVLERIRKPIDKAMDRVVGWVVGMARKLGRFVAQAGVPNDPNERLRLGVGLAVSAVNRFAKRPVAKAVLDPLLLGINTRYGFSTLETRPKGSKWMVFGVVNPTVGVDTDAEVPGITPLVSLTAAERVLIAVPPGGVEELALVDELIAGGSAKVIAEVAMCRTVLELLRRGTNVSYIGLEIFKQREHKALTEIDILTPDEMIEVKSGAKYINQDRLTGDDKEQFMNLRNFFESKITVVDRARVVIRPPARFIYQFMNPIHPDLYRWLKDNRVTEVRVAI